MKNKYYTVPLVLLAVFFVALVGFGLLNIFVYNEVKMGAICLGVSVLCLFGAIYFFLKD